jgi:pimeloyl-ACP methyl ester carboxylesterase
MREVRRFRHFSAAAAAVVALVALGACTSAEPSVSAPATAGRAPGSVTLEAEQDLVVGGRHFKAQCTGRGPSVLLVSGYGSVMGDWGDLPTRLGATARTCMYDRLGVDRSDAPRGVQTFEDIADDLDGVISALRLRRPVVLVAHSFGGPIAVTWAARHQPDARALVLLDTIPPGWQAALTSLIPPPDPSDPELTEMIEGHRSEYDPVTHLERLDPGSWTAYDRISRLDMPLRVIVAGVPPRLPAALDAAKWTAAWNAGQRRLAGLSSDAHIVTAPDADDIIWLWRLDLVLSTVADALSP